MANNPINQEKEEGAPVAAAIKEVLCTGIVGKVKWFNVKRGYGFVCRKDTEEDVFIHQSAIVKNNPSHQRRSVGDGEDILFDIVKGEKGNEAANVCGADGNHVRGSEYALRYQKSGRGRPRGRGRGRGGIVRSRGPSDDYDSYPQEFVRGGPPRGGRSFRGGDGRSFRGGEGRSFRGGDGRSFRGGDRNFRGGDGRNFRGGEERSFRGGEERSFRGGEERSFGGSEERNFRGGDGRSFRGGGRPYLVQYRKSYPEYEMPPPPAMYYDYEYFAGPVRGRGGGFRGPQMFRGGGPTPLQRDIPMNFNRYDYERRPSRGGRGRFRNSRGRGRVGPRDNVQLKDEGEEHLEEKISGEHHE